MNQNWPYNGKSLWNSLRPGQRWAAVLGVPILSQMYQAYVWGLHLVTDSKPIEAFALFVGFFVLPYIYVQGIGMVLAVLIEYLFYPRK